MRTRSLKVIDMAVHDVATITADKNIQECAAQMRAEHVGSLVVINADRKPIGMITDRDIAIEVVARKRNPEELTVKDVMTAPVVTATPNEGMVTALARMREFGIRRLPIVSEEGTIVAEGEVVRFGGRCCGVGRLGAQGRHFGHRRGGRSLLLLGLDAPGADVGVPASVVLARLDVDRDLVGCPFAQPGHVVGLVEERDADLARE